MPTKAEIPFGGIKESGIGREGAAEGIEEYMETKYFIRALEMTTEEIHGFRSLFPMDESQFSQWVQFLNEADMVKYAREIPSPEKMFVDKEKISSLIHQLYLIYLK